MKSTSTRLPTRAGRGTGGVLQSAADLVITMIAGGNHTTANRLKAGEAAWLKSAAAKDFADSASPGHFLWFVSCADTRNERITVFRAEPTDRQIPIYFPSSLFRLVAAMMQFITALRKL